MAVVAGLALGLAAAEVLARALLGAADVLPAGDVYRPSSVPGVGYTLIPGFEGFALGAPLQTNAAGYRGPEWSRRKPAGVLRIALVGDSHAFGFGVRFEDTMGARLERRLQRTCRAPIEVLNFGVPGYNAEQEAAVLERVALSFSPDLVILVPSSNDHEPAQEAGSDGYLRASGSSRSDVGWLVRALVRRSRLFRLARLRWRRWERGRIEASAVPAAEDGRWMDEVPPGPIPESLRSAVGSPVARMLDLCRARGVPVVLAPFAGDAEYRRLFRSLGERPGVSVVELLGAFPEVRSWEELQVRHGLGWDPHLGPEAHRRWAEALHGRVAEQGVFRRACRRGAGVS